MEQAVKAKVRTLERVSNLRKALFQKKNAYPVLLALLTISYNFIWLNRSFTMSEGWSKVYLSLIAEGRVPYRDFYYNLPPLNLLIDAFIWSFSFETFFVFRLWRLAERVLIAEIMYGILRRKLEPFPAFLGAFLSILLASANVYDLVGDYNQTTQLFAALLCLTALRYAECIGNLRAKRKWMFLAGVIIGLMFLCKQTIFVACAGIFSLLLIFVALIKAERNFFQMALLAAAGVTLPLLACFLWLSWSGAFSDFWYQVFIDTGSKGTLLHILFGTQLNAMWDKRYGILSIFFALGIWLAERAKTRWPQAANILPGVQAVLLVFVGMCVGFAYMPDMIGATLEGVFSGLFVVMALLAAPLLYLEVRKGKKHLFFAAELAVCVVLLLLNLNQCAASLYWRCNAFGLVSVAITLIHFVLVCWALVHVICHITVKSELELDTMVIVCVGIASGWATLMSSGMATVGASTSFLSVPAMTLLIFRGKKVTPVILKVLFEFSVLIFLCVCMSQKLVCNYRWWGEAEASFWDKTETSDIPALKGFLFSPHEKAKFDELNRVISLNTDENSVIFGFPYTKVYNVFLSNYNMRNFVPVLFYDTCPDDYARQDARTLSLYEPDIVVWQDIPACMETHERVYRDGNPMGQREIQKWFSLVKDRDYEWIGQVGDVFVYRRKKDNRAAYEYEYPYTYIQEPHRVNATAVYSG